MRRPERDISLPAGFECSASDIDSGAWQDHLVRHPLGVHRKTRGVRPVPWNEEGWDKTKPPVITESRRAKLVREISQLSSGAARCLVPEFTNRNASVVEPEVAYCKRCNRDLRSACARACEVDGVSDRYGALIDLFLEAVQEGTGEIVSRTELIARLLKKAGSRQTDEGIFVMSWGFAPGHAGLPIVRIARGDGTRVEFYIENGKQLSWRTTYRSVVSDAAIAIGSAQRRFLCEFPQTATSFGALSDRCVVPRPWWRSHAS